MCGLFLAVDPAEYEAETRTVRLHGHVTSVRLERSFWAIIDHIAAREEISTGRFITTLHDEVLDRDGEVPNFASLLALHYVLDKSEEDCYIAWRLYLRRVPDAL